MPLTRCRSSARTGRPQRDVIASASSDRLLRLEESSCRSYGYLLSSAPSRPSWGNPFKSASELVDVCIPFGPPHMSFYVRLLPTASQWFINLVCQYYDFVTCLFVIGSLWPASFNMISAFKRFIILYQVLNMSLSAVFFNEPYSLPCVIRLHKRIHPRQLRRTAYTINAILLGIR